ncbi:MAG: hypothetical protein IPJ65_35740 [Archangiaceae bacterium]|nr:hypothetical protein [Archangiaceae bacterium]
MSPALTALVLAAGVVKLESGSAVVVRDGVLVTTHAVAFGSARPEAKLEDGGTVRLLRTVFDDPKLDLALVVFDSDEPPPRFSARLPDAGMQLTALTGDAAWPARVLSASGTTLTLDLADAGPVGGAALVDADGTVWGLARDARTGISSTALTSLLEALSQPPKGQLGATRLRNLGISAAFFLGLSVWWVYRSRARRY